MAITRRDLAVSLITCAVTAGAFAFADRTPVMGSTVFDWDTIKSQPTETGSVRAFCDSRTATLDELEVHATTLDPGKASHPPHRHPNEEMIIVRQGTVETFESGAWKRLGPGSVIFNASNQLHAIRNAGDEPAIYHVINWKTAATPKADEH